MAGSREILKNLLPKDASSGIVYLLGGAGVMGGLYLLYHFRGKQPRPGYEQKMTFSPDGKATMEEKLVPTVQAISSGNRVTGGNLDTRALGQHPVVKTTNNTVRDGDLAGAAIQTGPISEAALPGVLEQTGPRKRQGPDSSSSVGEGEPEKRQSLSPSRR